MQYEGVAEILVAEDAIRTCKQRFIDKNSPTTQEYLDRPDVVFFTVRPTWISLSDYSGSPSVTVLEDFEP
jgi:hypothetical protein